MNINFFKETRILDGGMGQELLAKGLVSKGSLWSSGALINNKYHQLVVDTHLSFIEAGSEVIVTNTFASRRVRFEKNNVGKQFEYANKIAGELAVKAREKSKKDILIAGGLPSQNDTYCEDLRDNKIISKNFKDQAEILNPYIDFFYLDVISSGKEIEIASEIIDTFNKPVLLGIHFKKNGMLPSGETITEIVSKNNTNNWLGIISACVSPEIANITSNELRSLKIPFGSKVNLWNIEEPVPNKIYNKTDYDEIGINPNITMGVRKEMTLKKFKKFIETNINNGATILGGCCETTPAHIKEISKFKL